MKSKWGKPTKLASLLKKFKTDEKAASDVAPAKMDTSDPVSQFVYSWLLWEASTEQAAAAFEKILDAHVDFNELRVSLPHELIAIVGKRYPRAEERFSRMKKSLHSIYLNHHSVTLDHLASQNKRDAKSYLENLDAIDDFVSQRMLVVCCGVHAMPVDEQLTYLLHEHGVIDEVVAPGALSSWLATTVKADQGVASLQALQAAVDAAWEDGLMTKINRRRRAEREAEENARRKAEEAAKAEAARKIELEEARKAAAEKKEIEKKLAAKKAAEKKIADKKAAVKKAAAKKAAAKKAAAKKVAAKKAAAKKAAAKKVAAKKAAAKKAAAKKAAAKKVAAKKAKQKTTKKAPAKKAPAKKVTKKAAAKKTKKKTTKKTTKKAAAKKTTKKAPAKKTAAKKTKKKTTKKASSRKRGK